MVTTPEALQAANSPTVMTEVGTEVQIQQATAGENADGDRRSKRTRMCKSQRVKCFCLSDQALGVGTCMFRHISDMNSATYSKTLAKQWEC